jgi:thiol-disulfide isomerase/thioredoxin
VGVFRNIGKQVALRLSTWVARNELFERTGERPTEPALPPGAWSGSSDASEAIETEESADEDDDDPVALSMLRSPAEIKAGLQSGPMVVNHWATWCESCLAEKDMVRGLAERITVPMVGVSWDVFEGSDPATALADVEKCSTESRLNWNHWVVDATPEAFFEVFPLENKSVPQTWVVNAEGEIVYRVDGMVGAQEADEIVRHLGSMG